MSHKNSKESGKGRSPSTESAANQFQVQLESPNSLRKIYAALQQADPDNPMIIIADDLFAPPIEDVKITLEVLPEGRAFDCTVYFNTNMTEKVTLKRRDFRRLFAALQESGRIQNAKLFGHNSSLLAFRLGKTGFILDTSNFEDGFSLSTGNFFTSVSLVRKFPPPEFKKQTFVAVMNEIIQAIELIAQTAYRLTKQDPQGARLVLQAPAIEGEVARKKIKKEAKTKVTKVTFADVGGNQAALQELRDLVSAINNPEAFHKWGARPPRGILLFGPPGTGKTLMARAVANEIDDARFVEITSTDLYEKWVGSSGQNARRFFDEARQHAGRTIFFLDEIDKLLLEEGDLRGSEHQQVMSIFLQEMSGAQNDPRFTIIAATNRLAEISSALRRSGRFDLKIEVPLPDESGRQQIFQIHIDRAEKLAGRSLFDQLEWPSLGLATRGWSGADIDNVIQRLLNGRAKQQISTGQPAATISQAELLQAIKSLALQLKINRRPLGFSGAREETR